MWADTIYVIYILVIEFIWNQVKSIRNMKFCWSKIRINGKEVIKSELLIWEEAGVGKGWCENREKEDQKKLEKDLKNQIMLLVFSGVTFGTAPLLSCR